MSDEHEQDETEPDAYEAPSVEDLTATDGPSVTAAGGSGPG